MLVIMGHASALAIVPNMLISPRTHAESWWSSIHPIRCDRFGARYRRLRIPMISPATAPSMVHFHRAETSVSTKPTIPGLRLSRRFRNRLWHKWTGSAWESKEVFAVPLRE